MELEIFRLILLSIFIPLAGFKFFKFYKKLLKLSDTSIKEQLEKIYRK
tara:strand:+ start:875 stop:1018 length:144 start_codon:yes stop_codon:yes gene_type:complete